MADYILATANKGKVQEIQTILSEFGIDTISREEFGIDFEIEETGSSFIDNALLKAKAICKASGLPAIADDSGLVVDALGGAPGIYSSSYGGEHLSDAERCEYLLSMMKNKEQRSAKFVATIACVFPDGEVITAIGECEGEITKSPRGTGGFGYDSVFQAKCIDKTLAELMHEEKNALSHRGKALREIGKLLISKK